MNNTGSDSPLDIDPNGALPLPTNRRVPSRIIILGIIALVFAVVVGTQVMGVLYAIFFPPAAPVPDQVTLVSHTSKDYGVDDWLYSSKMTACDVVRFYQSKDGQCRVAPLLCNDAAAIQALPSTSNDNVQNVARCVSTQDFSIFALRWEVIIASSSSANEQSEFRLNREIYWTGAVPPNNPPSLDSGFPQSSSGNLQSTKTS